MFLPIFIKKYLKTSKLWRFQCGKTENELFNYIIMDFTSSIDFFQICVGPEKDRFLWTYYYTVMKANIRNIFLLLLCTFEVSSEMTRQPSWWISSAGHSISEEELLWVRPCWLVLGWTSGTFEASLPKHKSPTDLSRVNLEAIHPCQ